MQTISLGIEGMTCNGCVASVTKILQGVQGVDGVEVTLTPSRARVTFDPTVANAERLKVAIEEAGYAVSA